MNTIKKQFYVGLASLALILTSHSAANAQKGEFGVRFMPTFSNLSLNTSTGNTIEGSTTLGYGVGAFVGFNFNSHIGIQLEGIYTSITQKYKEQETNRKINLKYFNVPLLLSLNTNKFKVFNFNIVGGPQLGVSVGSSMESTGGDGTTQTNGVLSVKKGDVGVAFGAGLDFGMNPAQTIRVGFGFRGVRGLFDISDNNANQATDSYYVLDRTKIKTNAVYIGASILF
jgi:Outer membrane protein beta-barrel domain